jgi:hypothetical protein
MVFLSFTNVIGYVILGNVNAVIYFILISLFVAFFSRNMSLILFTALIVTNLIIVNKIPPSTEGFENEKDENKDINNKNNKKNTNNVEIPKDNEKSSQLNDSLPIVPSPTPSEPFSGGTKLSGSKVDYASTVENAYKNLNEMLGSDGMKHLTNDTQKLMEQQKNLVEQMQSMTPLIQNITPLLNQTKDMLGSMNMGNIDEIASLVTNMTGSK